MQSLFPLHVCSNKWLIPFCEQEKKKKDQSSVIECDSLRVVLPFRSQILKLIQILSGNFSIIQIFDNFILLIFILNCNNQGHQNSEQNYLKIYIHFFLSIIPKWPAPPQPVYTLLCSMLTEEIQEKLVISPRLCFSLLCKP